MIAFSTYRHRHALMLSSMHITIINKRLTPKTQKIVDRIIFNRITKMYINSFITIKVKSFINLFKPLYTINDIMVFSFFISNILSRNVKLNNFLIIVHTKTIFIKTISINVATINVFFDYKHSVFFRD